MIQIDQYALLDDLSGACILRNFTLMTSETIQKVCSNECNNNEQKGATQLHAADRGGAAQLFNKKYDAHAQEASLA